MHRLKDARVYKENANKRFEPRHQVPAHGHAREKVESRRVHENGHGRCSGTVLFGLEKTISNIVASRQKVAKESVVISMHDKQDLVCWIIDAETMF